MSMMRVFSGVAVLVGETARGLAEWVLAPMPGPPGYALRWLYYKLILAELGWGTLIDTGVRIEHPRRVRIGRHCWIDRDVLLMGGVRDPMKGRPGRWLTAPDPSPYLSIGDRTHIGPGCLVSGLAGVRIGSELTLAAGTKVYSLSHHYRSLDSGRAARFVARGVPSEAQFMLAGPVEIGDRSGSAMNSVILPGSCLGEDAFLGIGAVLLGRARPGWVYEGHPARPVRPRERRN